MARLVVGLRGACWRAPEWIARNFCSEVVAVLRGLSGGAVPAQRIAEMLAGDVAVVDLTTILDDPQTRSAWLHALDVALLLVEAERPDDWNDPSLFGPFVGSVRRFVDGEHGRVAAVASAAEPADAVIDALPWILDGGLDREDHVR